MKMLESTAWLPLEAANRRVCAAMDHGPPPPQVRHHRGQEAGEEKKMEWGGWIGITNGMGSVAAVAGRILSLFVDMICLFRSIIH